MMPTGGGPGPGYPAVGEPATVRLPRVGPGYPPEETATDGGHLGSTLLALGRPLMVVVTFVLVELMFMVLAFKYGEYLAGFMVLFLNAAVAGMVAIAWARRTSVARSSVGSAGLTLRPATRLDVSVLVTLASGALGSGLFGYLQLTTDPQPQLDTIVLHSIMFDTFSPALGTAVLATVTAPLLVALVTVAVRGGIGGIRFNAEGFAFDSVLRSVTGRWDEIFDITDSPSGGLPFARRPVTVQMVDGTYRTLRSPGLYTPGGDMLREMMRFYWQNPGYRTELTDVRALDRFRTAAAAASH